MESKEEILEKHCPSMNTLYLDANGEKFRGRILDAMTEHAAPLHARIAELEAEVKSANERIKKVSTILVEVHGFSKTGILYKILNP